MTTRVHLGDGGPLHHPRQPLGFHPHLRAAAFLLLCAEKRLGMELLLARDYQTHPAEDLAHLAAEEPFDEENV